MLIRYTITVAALFLLIGHEAFPLSDTTESKKIKKEKIPKHYFKNTLYFNSYSTPEVAFQKSNDSSYSFVQNLTGFYFPIYTRDKYKDDSTRIANLHVLFTGILLSAAPNFSFVQKQHIIYKGGFGVRMFYNTGKKNIWFFDISPFYTQDDQSISSFSAKYSSLFLFNRTVNERFSYRLGLTKTFVLGNRYYFPIIGFRLGKLDGAYFSFMFPRNMSLNFPIGKKAEGSIFMKPHGGIYNFTNSENIYNGQDSIILYGRWELSTGLKIDVNISQHFSFFLSTGVANNRSVSFYSFSYNSDRIGTLAPFSKWPKHIEPSLFFNFGLSFRFGKVKKVYNNMNMYDVFDLNNNLSGGDTNENPAGKEIPRKGDLKPSKKIQYRDIQDLIEFQDILN